MLTVFLGGWLAFLVAWLTFTAITAIFFYMYKSKRAGEFIVTFMCLVTFFSVFALFCLPALDVFLLSSAKNASGQFNDWATADVLQKITKSLTIVYYLTYSTSLFMIFIGLPFSFFYVNGDASPKKRLISATKYTVLFLIVVITLFVIGIILKPNTHPDGDRSDKLKYLEGILKANAGELGIYFCVGCVSIVGCLVWVSYMAYGLFALPLTLLIPEPGPGNRTSDMDGYRLMGDAGDEAEEIQPRNTTGQIFGLTFKVILGLISLAFSLLLFVSVFITGLDKSLHSLGPRYGFTLKHNHIFNPINFFVTLLHKIYPCDYILLVVIMVYFLFCGLFAMKNMGIRILLFKVFDIRKGHTSPQALLAMSFILALIIISWTSILMNIAPQYATFGSQLYNNNGTITTCSTEAPAAECIMTRTAMFFNRLIFDYPIFGCIFFGFNWFFIATSLLSTPFVIYRRRHPKVISFLDHYDDDLDDVGAFGGSDDDDFNRTAYPIDDDNDDPILS